MNKKKLCIKLAMADRVSEMALKLGVNSQRARYIRMKIRKGELSVGMRDQIYLAYQMELNNILDYQE